jgi:hypothetical protein
VNSTTCWPEQPCVTVTRPDVRVLGDELLAAAERTERTERSAPVAPTPGVRALLTAFCCLTAVAVVSLVLLADRTAETFAWTIQPAVSAAFLGSGYGAGFVLSVLAVRSGDWREVRVPFLTVLVFTWVTAVATFFHLHRLHVMEAGTGPIAEPAAWLWLAVYVVVPVGMAVLLPRQPRTARAWRRASRAVPMPRALTAALVAQGLVLAVVGLALLVRCFSSHGMPATSHGTAHAAMTTHAGMAGATDMSAPVDVLWPWTLGPLASGAVAAWLLAFAVAVALCVADGDLLRLRTATRAYAAFGALELLTVLRFRDDVAWSSPGAWAFVVLAVAVTVTGATGWALATRGRGTGTGRRTASDLDDDESGDVAASTSA